MADLFTLWPIVGDGTAGEPYRVSFLPLDPAGQVALIRGGFTCWHPDAGTLLASGSMGARAVDSHAALASAAEVARTTSHAVLRLDVTPELEDAFFAELTGVYLFARSLEGLLEEAEWVAPPFGNVTGEVDVLAESPLVEYWADVLTPAALTPAVFPGLTDGARVDLDVLAELEGLDLADDSEAWQSIQAAELLALDGF